MLLAAVKNKPESVQNESKTLLDIYGLLFLPSVCSQCETLLSRFGSLLIVMKHIRRFFLTLFFCHNLGWKAESAYDVFTLFLFYCTKKCILFKLSFYIFSCLLSHHYGNTSEWVSLFRCLSLKALRLLFADGPRLQDYFHEWHIDWCNPFWCF